MKSPDQEPDKGDTDSEPKESVSWSRGWDLYRRLWPELKPELRVAAVIGLLMLISVPSGVISPLLIQRLFDEILPKRDTQALLGIGAWITGLTLIAAGFQYWQSLLALRIQARIRFRLTRKVIDHLLRLPMRFFHRTETGYLMSRVRDDVVALDTLLPSALVGGVIDLLRAILFFVLLLVTDVGLALSGFFLTLALFGLVLILSPALRRRSERARESDAKSSGSLHEALSGMTTVRYAAKEASERRRVSRFVKRGLRDAVARDVLGEITQTVLGLIGSLGLYAILAVGAYRIMNGDSTIGGLFAFSIYLTQLMGATGSLFHLVPSIQEGLASLERIFGLLDERTESDRSEAKARDRSLRGKVEFRKVCFSYEREVNALEQITFVVEPGETLAIVGRSGSGKSTLVSLMTRLYDPSEGEIFLDDQPIDTYSLRALRRQIGVVPQDVFLFNRTVGENLSYAQLGTPSEQDMDLAAKLAHAAVFIDKLPDRYETVVGERGVRLSGGEKQRLAMAREILRDPPILILDEATSSLDSESESLIQEAMTRLMKNRTSFVIAHRLSTVQNADRILVLDEGRIAGLGPHQELLETCSIYRTLYERQVL